MNVLLLGFGGVVVVAATVPHRPWARLVLVAIGLSLIAAAVFWL